MDSIVHLEAMNIGLLFKWNGTVGQHMIGYVNFDYVSDLDKWWLTTG